MIRVKLIWSQDSIHLMWAVIGPDQKLKFLFDPRLCYKVPPTPSFWAMCDPILIFVKMLKKGFTFYDIDLNFIILGITRFTPAISKN